MQCQRPYTLVVYITSRDPDYLARTIHAQAARGGWAHKVLTVKRTVERDDREVTQIQERQ